MEMNQRRYFLIVTLLCCCGAVNVIFYVLTNDARKYINDAIGQRHKPGTAKESGARRPDVFLRTNGLSSLIRKLSHAGSTEDITSVNVSPTFYEPESSRLFEFSINRVNICGINRTNSIVVMVISKIDNFERRNAIRNTWGSVVKELNGTVAFLVGKSQHIAYQQQVIKESELYADVVQVNVMERYENLTLKSIAMLQWLTDYCSNSEFFLKVDDDVYANVENILLESRAQKETDFFLCHVFKSAPPIRDPTSKWYVSRDHYSKPLFPTYCSGPAYVMSSNIISKLYVSSLKAKLCIMEDVFITGIAAEGIDIVHVHSGQIYFNNRPATGCEYARALTGHEVTVKQMYVIFAQLTNHEINCLTKENIILKKTEAGDTDLFNL